MNNIKADIAGIAAIVAIMCVVLVSILNTSEETPKDELLMCSKMCEIHKSEVITFQSGTCVCK